MIDYETAKATAAAQANLTGGSFYVWHDGSGGHIVDHYLEGVPTIEAVTPGRVDDPVGACLETAILKRFQLPVRCVDWIQNGMRWQPVIQIVELGGQTPAQVEELLRPFGVLVI